ncbi:MAG: shikimate kinase AroL [Desulfovibrio sp.]|jgi:shikimate kinase|nr:shikimate kinase AroL [Desulfovibrio sp.]
MVYLVGARACGKTTVGLLLARKLHFLFADTDACVCERASRSVAEIVAAEGWEGFRRRESDALRECGALCTGSERGIVVATGGGMVLKQENRDHMRATGSVFFLSVPPELLSARLTEQRGGMSRPLLTGMGVAEEVTHVLAERLLLYTQTAHYSVDGARPPEEVCAEILRIVS